MPTAKPYDCTSDVIEHQRRVKSWMERLSCELTRRSDIHDASKLLEPEKSMFDEYTHRLKTTEFGSDEYKAHLVSMGEALKHHYQNNRHHPEHYPMWQCPMCQSIFKDQDAPPSIYENSNGSSLRLCPKCCANGTIMECTLEPASGVYGMTLLDVVEMVCDWMAASEQKGQPINMDYLIKRFGISPQLAVVISNTLREFEYAYR